MSTTLARSAMLPVAAIAALMLASTRMWVEDPAPPAAVAALRVVPTPAPVADATDRRTICYAAHDLTACTVSAEPAADVDDALRLEIGSLLAAPRAANDTVRLLAALLARRPHLAAAFPAIAHDATDRDAARLVQALQRDGGDASRRALVAIADDDGIDNAARGIAMRALADLSVSDPEALATLDRIACAATTPPTLSATASRALARVLSQLPAADARAVVSRAHLVTALRSATDPAQQCALLAALTRCAQPLALEALRYLDHDDARVRLAAATAIAADHSPSGEQIARAAIDSTRDQALRDVLEHRFAATTTDHRAGE